jgi:hypothetical protein
MSPGGASPPGAPQAGHLPLHLPRPARPVPRESPGAASSTNPLGSLSKRVRHGSLGPCVCGMAPSAAFEAAFGGVSSEALQDLDATGSRYRGLAEDESHQRLEQVMNTLQKKVRRGPGIVVDTPEVVLFLFAVSPEQRARCPCACVGGGGCRLPMDGCLDARRMGR